MVLIDRMRRRQGRWSLSSRCRSGVPTPGTRSPGPVENTTGRRNGLRLGQVADHRFHLLPGLHLQMETRWPRGMLVSRRGGLALPILEMPSPHPFTEGKRGRH